MTTLPTKGFSTIVGSIAAGMQGRVKGRFLNFALGSVFRALAEAYAGVALWLQALALSIAKLTRLSTSYGSDVDSFIADFPLVTRFSAQASTGLCQFARYTATSSPAFVPVGGLVRTKDGSQTFAVTADATNPAYSPTYILPNTTTVIGGYAIPALGTAVLVPVVSATNGASGAPGANGNVAAGAISLIASTMYGVDTVSNPGAFLNGSDSEGDEALKARFRLAVLGRSGGTRYAIRSAVANVRNGLRCTILENQDLNGSPDIGMVTVIVDDGTGTVSPDVLASATAAIVDNGYGARASGVRYGVYPASISYVTVTMVVTSAAGYVHNDVVTALASALTGAINTTRLGRPLTYFGLSTVALAVPGVSSIASYTLNKGTADLPASVYAVYRVAPSGLTLS